MSQVILAQGADDESCPILSWQRWISCFFLLILLPLSVSATTFTYEWTQTYSYNDNPLIFGSAVVFDITFDNGNSTNINQTYYFGDVVDLTVRTIGGTYAQSLSAQISPAVILGKTENDVLITTDSNDAGVVNPTNWSQYHGNSSQHGVYLSTSQFYTQFSSLPGYPIILNAEPYGGANKNQAWFSFNNWWDAATPGQSHEGNA